MAGRGSPPRRRRGNGGGLRDSFGRAMGFARENDRKFDWDAQWDATRFLYRPFLEKSFRFEPEYIERSYDILMFQNPNKMRINNPPEWLFLNRLQWGLFRGVHGYWRRGAVGRAVARVHREPHGARPAGE